MFECSTNIINFAQFSKRLTIRYIRMKTIKYWVYMEQPIKHHYFLSYWFVCRRRIKVRIYIVTLVYIHWSCKYFDIVFCIVFNEHFKYIVLVLYMHKLQKHNNSRYLFPCFTLVRHTCMRLLYCMPHGYGSMKFCFLASFIDSFCIYSVSPIHIV